MLVPYYPWFKKYILKGSQTGFVDYLWFSKNVLRGLQILRLETIRMYYLLNKSC